MGFLFKFSAWGSEFTEETSENALSPSQMSSTAIYSLQPSARHCSLVNVQIDMDMHFFLNWDLVECFRVDPQILVIRENAFIKKIHE